VCAQSRGNGGANTPAEARIAHCERAAGKQHNQQRPVYPANKAGGDGCEEAHAQSPAHLWKLEDKLMPNLLLDDEGPILRGIQKR
jgi:hypothetical protein